VPSTLIYEGIPQVGLFLVRGPNVFSGYRNRPEETSKVFDGGWFRTGDLGYFDDDGYLYVTGRASTLIVTSGGKNIQPEAVEAAYLENPLIREFGVLQKDGRLVAVIVPETGEISRGTDTHHVIREAVEEASKHLPSYQRISDYAIRAANYLSSRGSASSGATSWRSFTNGPGEAWKGRPLGPSHPRRCQGKTERCSKILQRWASGSSWPNAILTGRLRLRPERSST
jgi:acyl-CoA synthetase (AMP-forming)/AMP-acid ligase II